ncbi:MAG: hypothetical protein NZ473_01005 [Candidatus Kapabacteria bacterium]|nr:hypothetical protein [Candidatus Kapabacteria bacterium]MCS7168994.1 hypothetical protein [Candidatus Kapabacteria bacterium]MDW7997208.1 hypothetical protein [Bacteroidota bacterium]MDW8224771.1 hypothetical protein [Bacteroidota bacterium]
MPRWFVPVIACCSIAAEAQQEFQLTLPKRFPEVWRAVKQAITERGCQLEYERHQEDTTGLLFGIIRSEYCVLVQGEDSARVVMERYSVEIPRIRGARWMNGRVQFTARLRELDTEGVELRLGAELSGMEGYITNRVHFWASNGVLERKLLQRLSELLGLPAEVVSPAKPEPKEEEEPW